MHWLKQNPTASRSGFSTAELLVVLAVLGVIAAFTIPKVLNSNAPGHKAALKQTLSTVANILQEGVSSGTLTAGNFGSYFQQRLNYVKFCNNGNTDGCWPAGTMGSAGNGNENAYIFANGVVLGGLNPSPLSNPESFTLDANGEGGPNQQGVDQLRVALCYGPSNCSAGADRFATGYANEPGNLGPRNDSTAANLALFDSLFSNN
ncbi:MAG: prepilin-type N-terminal cleavage/methylation domain-containing protein [Candidatus Melainabacteria bacterium]|nr:prepilin-type N-terminal cleavage/methylation domain-containing protein [Candidatus Melainabacteria bacterium]